MGVLKPTKWTEEKVRDKLRLYFLSPSAKKYEIANLFVFGWESDYLAITKSLVSYEIEIKISKADFKNEAKHKVDKYLLLEGGKEKLGRYSGGVPNYFYYAVPDGLITEEEIPEFAGLIYVNPWGVTIVKAAKKLTEEKFDAEKYNLTDKFYYNMWTWRNKFEEFRDSAEEIKKLKQEIRSFNKTFNTYEELIGNKEWEISELKDEIKRLRDENGKGSTEDSQGIVPEAGH